MHAALTPDDVTTLVCDVFRQRCAITGARLLDPSRPQFCLCRLDPARPATLTNTLLLTVEAAKRHEAEGLAGLPPALVDHLRRTYAEAFGGRERSAFDDALRAEGLVRDEAPLDNAPAAGSRTPRSRCCRDDGGLIFASISPHPHPHTSLTSHTHYLAELGAPAILARGDAALGGGRLGVIARHVVGLPCCVLGVCAPVDERGEPGRQLRTDDIGTDWSPASSRSIVVRTVYATEPRVPDGERDFAV